MTRHFYPQDIKIVVIDGKRHAQLDFSLPTVWTPAALHRAKTNWIDGWEMARRAYEEQRYALWLQQYHPHVVQELEQSKRDYEAYKIWMNSLIKKGILVNTLEYRTAQKEYKARGGRVY